MFQYFFAKSGTVEPYKIFSSSHFILIFISAFLIVCALWRNRHANEKMVLYVTRHCAVLLWILEFMKIAFNILAGNGNNPNTYIPLYFCSIPLYCSVMSGWGSGKVKRVGDVFMTVGGMVGGVAYLISPNTTAGQYQAFHFITMQSFVLHSIMIFLSSLYVITGYHKLIQSDWKYYALTIVTMCITALTVNYFLDSNLMFLSKNFPGTPVEVLYNFSPVFFPFWMTFIQAIPPFIVIYALVSLLKRFVSSIREAQSLENNEKDLYRLV